MFMPSESRLCGSAGAGKCAERVPVGHRLHLPAKVRPATASFILKDTDFCAKVHSDMTFFTENCTLGVRNVQENDVFSQKILPYKLHRLFLHPKKQN
jgi:hypothetical protein